MKHTVKVHFSNGDSLVTDINGSKDSVAQYYAMGRTFNLGVEDDLLVKVTAL